MKGWQEQDGALVREFQLRDFDEALDFLEGLSQRAVDWRGRRPDVFIRYGLVRLSISNRHKLGITEAERRLAEKVNAVLDAHQAAMDLGQAGYTDPATGLFVFTAAQLASRGTCCDSGCRHCPYI